MTLSAPLLWIVSPALAALALLVISRWARLTTLLGTLLALGLAGLAWQLPIGEILDVAGRSFVIEPTLVFLGRRLELLPEQLPLLALIYLQAAFWLGGTYVARAGRLTVPLGLAVVSFLIAALAVQPFLYAALLIEIAVLLCVPLLATADFPLGRGVLRFVTFQTFGMPFILFTGHLLAGIESNPGDPILSLRVGMLMGLGFGFLLAIFPFHSWMPILGEESHPYVSVFVFVFLPQMVMLFGLGFIERFAWMRTVPVLFDTLRWVALGMIVLGGVWASFQSHLGRLLGYAVMLEVGFGMYAIAMLPNTSAGLLLLFALLPGRVIAFQVWALALSVLQKRTSAGYAPLTLKTLRGLGRRYPLAAAGLLLAMFSLVGLPLLASFAPRFALLALWWPTNSLGSLVALVGGAGLLLAALRTLMVLFASREDNWAIEENHTQSVFLLAGVGLLFALGLLSPRLLPWFESLARAFQNLSQ